MFYNYCRSTRSTLNSEERKKAKKKQLSMTNSPRNRILNLTKRQKLKNLLLLKFKEKYCINYPDQTIEKEVTKFVQAEKLTDKDLQRLNDRVQRLIRNNSGHNILLTKTLSKKLKDPSNFHDNINYNPQVSKVKFFGPFDKNEENNVFTELNNKNNTNNITRLNNTLYPRNDIVSLPKVKDTIENKAKTLQHSQSSMNLANKTLSIFPKSNYYNKKFFKSPEEELAELEKELEINDYNSKRPREKRMDFSKEGNEWNAISKYKQNLYRQQLIEERIKENEMKKRTKEDLDHQIKLKIQKEHEENIREKEFNEILNENLKKMDEIDKIKAEKIKNQFQQEKESRDQLLKDAYTRRKIEYLKEKKLDKEIVSNVKKNLERELTERKMKKKLANEDMKKGIKELEIKKIKLKQLIQQQKEEEMTFLKEKEQTEIKKDKERQKIFDKINYNANKFILKNAEEIVAKNKEEQKKENEKIEFYIKEKIKAMEEQELKERKRKNELKIELKKFLDMQVEEKRKEQIFLKELDHEQARIWKMDYQKRDEDEKINDNKIKLMEKKNLEFIIKQIKENDQKKMIKNKNKMTNDEYDMNKELLEKAKNSFLNGEKN